MCQIDHCRRATAVIMLAGDSGVAAASARLQSRWPDAVTLLGTHTADQQPAQDLPRVTTARLERDRLVTVGLL
jgi:hypothetical protein